MNTKRNLTFREMVDLSFGFFGVQIAYALQSANISRIFATLGADPHTLSFFWILPPLMGMIVQPLIGKYSDRTWCKMGRRKPYLLVGAIVAVLVMMFLPNAGSLNLSTAYAFLGLNAAMWFGLFSLIFLDTSINVAMQPFKMMVGDMVGEEQKTTAYSIQSFLCNAGSLVGYLFPIFFTWIGIANTAPQGVVPDSVIWSFYAGAAILILCVIYTFMRVKEMPPKEYAEFHGIDLQAKGEKKESEGLFQLLFKASGPSVWCSSSAGPRSSICGPIPTAPSPTMCGTPPTPLPPLIRMLVTGWACFSPSRRSAPSSGPRSCRVSRTSRPPMWSACWSVPWVSPPCCSCMTNTCSSARIS